MQKKILMLSNAVGFNDGILKHHYIAGHEYILSNSLANNFIAMGVAELVCEKAKQEHQNKSLTPSDYQNKSDKPKGAKK